MRPIMHRADSSKTFPAGPRHHAPIVPLSSQRSNRYLPDVDSPQDKQMRMMFEAAKTVQDFTNGPGVADENDEVHAQTMDEAATHIQVQWEIA